jgi:phage-related protein (TIGR01555 family)
VVRLLGAALPDDAMSDGWGDSVLQALLEAIDQATAAAAHIAAMLPEAKQDVISVPGLSQHLSTEDGTRHLTERFAYAARMKGLFGMLLLEGDGRSPEGERYQQKQLDFSGLPEVARLFLQVAAGAADIPVTRLLGQSPAGLNATGESDTRNYHDHVAARQAVELTPAIARLDRLLIRDALGRSEPALRYAWRPLAQASEREKAEVGRLKAETAAMLAREGVVPPAVLGRGVEGWLSGADLFPGIAAAFGRSAG